MFKNSVLISIILLTGILLSACQPDAPTEEPPLPPTQEPSEPPPDGQGEEEFSYSQNATVESLEVMMLESFPVQVQVVVAGYLPDGCTELYEIAVDHQDNDFILTLVTRRPTGDIACTQALVPFEEVFDLDIQGLEAGTYSVIAQELEATFTLDVDNVFPEDEDQDQYGYGSDAVVEELSLNIMESFPVQVSVTLAGYLPDGCTEIEEISSSRDGQEFEIEIVTRRPAGDVACTMAIVPFEETVSLDVEGLPAGDYSVRYSELRKTFTLEQDNEIQ